MFENKEMSHFIAIAIVWLLIIAIILYNIICFPKKVFKIITGKGVNFEDMSIHLFKYTLEPIFSHPTDGFDLNNTSIDLEIISEKNQRLASIEIKSDSFYITRSLCRVRDIRAFFVIIRKKSLPPIIRVRAIHSQRSGIHWIISELNVRIF